VLEPALAAECVAAGSETHDLDGRREPYAETLTVKKRSDPFDRFLQAMTALGPFITALAGAAWTGHNIGWW
jgi:hypothetical protein